MESKVEQDAMNAALGQKVDKKTFYDVLHFVVNNFEGAKEFVNAKVGTVSSASVQTAVEPRDEPLSAVSEPLIMQVAETDQKLPCIAIAEESQATDEVIPTPMKSEKKNDKVHGSSNALQNVKQDQKYIEAPQAH